jgi:hypothetical protein
MTLEVVAQARHVDGAVTVRGVDARDPKVPSWMLRFDAAAIRIATVSTLDVATSQRPPGRSLVAPLGSSQRTPLATISSAISGYSTMG